MTSSASSQTRRDRPHRRARILRGAKPSDAERVDDGLRLGGPRGFPLQGSIAVIEQEVGDVLVDKMRAMRRC